MPAGTTTYNLDLVPATQPTRSKPASQATRSRRSQEGDLTHIDKAGQMRGKFESEVPRELLSTYRYLRLAMPLLATLLAASVIFQITDPTPNCWLTSISAYYYTASRAVFVASLCAIGTCLIVYRGIGREDMALNFAGIFAFMVALIPTPLRPLVDAAKADEPLCARFNAPSEPQFSASLHNNLNAALVAAIAVSAVVVFLRLRLPDVRGSGKPGAGMAIGVPAATGIGWWLIFAKSQWVRDNGHIFSAWLFFLSVAVVVLMSVSPKRAGQPVNGPWNWYKTVYLGILILMATSALTLGLAILKDLLHNALFWLEASLIVLFIAFWIFQTIEHWNPKEPSSPRP